MNGDGSGDGGRCDSACHSPGSRSLHLPQCRCPVLCESHAKPFIPVCVSLACHPAPIVDSGHSTASCSSRLACRAAHKIKSETDDHAAEEAAATAHTPLLPRAQHGRHHFGGGPGADRGRDISAHGGRFRDSSNGRDHSGDSRPEKPAETQRRRQCEEALVETLKGLVRPDIALAEGSGLHAPCRPVTCAQAVSASVPCSTTREHDATWQGQAGCTTCKPVACWEPFGRPGVRHGTRTWTSALFGKERGGQA